MCHTPCRCRADGAGSRTSPHDARHNHSPPLRRRVAVCRPPHMTVRTYGREVKRRAGLRTHCTSSDLGPPLLIGAAPLQPAPHGCPPLPVSSSYHPRSIAPSARAMDSAPPFGIIPVVHRALRQSRPAPQQRVLNMAPSAAPATKGQAQGRTSSGLPPSVSLGLIRPRTPPEPRRGEHAAPIHCSSRA
jgi:hypothetical protein